MIIVKLLLGFFLCLFECRVGDEHEASLWDSFNIFSRLIELRLVINFSHWRVLKDFSVLERERACSHM